MKIKYLFIIIILVASKNCLSQLSTPFDKGFITGFNNGYCYTSSQNSIFCNPPQPPAFIPLPKYPEKAENFQDGYNRGFIVGLQRRRRDDELKLKGSSTNSSYPNNKVSIPKFNPYISQNPILYLSPDERAAIYAARANQYDALSYVLANVVEQIFTTSPEKRLQRLQRKKEKEYKKMLIEIEKNEEREANKLIIGSDQYYKKKKANKFWLTTSILSGTLAITSYLIANNYANQYSNATNNATSLRKNGNLAYGLTPVFSTISGVSLLNFKINHKKIKNAKSRFK